MISIIIIVKNDRKIDLTLQKLTELKKPDTTEILVVDASNGLLDDIKDKYKSVKWIYFENPQNKKITIPDQRNEGIKNAKGEIIVFIDADCIPFENWLKELVKPITHNNEKIVAGKVIMSDKDSLHKLEIDRKGEPEYLDEAPTMNLAIRNEVFNKVGIFDVKFQIGEDVDFLWRARAQNFNIRFNIKAVVYHDLGSFKHELKRMYNYGSARISLYMKHKYRIKYLPEELLKVLYPLFFILLPITIIYPVYLVLFLPILTLTHGKSFIGRLKNVLLQTMYGLGMLKRLLSIG